MSIQPKPDRKGGIGVGLPECGTPFGIPQVKIEMVGVGHLPAPIHVGMNSVFLSFARPRAQRTGKRCSSPHGLGPADGLPQPFLFLPVGCRMGCHILEDQRLCPLSDLALAEWT